MDEGKKENVGTTVWAVAVLLGHSTLPQPVVSGYHNVQRAESTRTNLFSDRRSCDGSLSYPVPGHPLPARCSAHRSPCVVGVHNYLIQEVQVLRLPCLIRFRLGSILLSG